MSQNQGYSQGNQGYSPNQGFNTAPQSPNVIVVPAQTGGCPSCGYTGPTRVNKKIGMVIIIWFLVLFFILCWILAWVPFVMDSCYDQEIVCGRCGMVINKRQAECC